MKKIVIATLILFFATNIYAQNGKSKKQVRKENRKEKVAAMVKLEEEGVIVNKKHFLSAVKLTNDGLGGFVEKGIAQSVGKALLFQLEITERFHPKEQKQTNIYTNGAGPYKYGKIINFYPVKLGVQQQILLGNKGNRNGLSLTANFGGGISLGLERPYLLGFDEVVNNARQLVYKKYSQDTIAFLNGSNITGPSFTKGFNMIKLNPGLYVKSGLRFDYGAYNELISAVEVGLTAEFYSRKVQQMAQIDGKNLFFGAYVALLFGKRK
jgi:hypothetical protein